MRAPITLKGAQRLREELDYLKSVKRPEIITAIAEAREHGFASVCVNGVWVARAAEALAGDDEAAAIDALAGLRETRDDLADVADKLFTRDLLQRDI